MDTVPGDILVSTYARVEACLPSLAEVILKVCRVDPAHPLRTMLLTELMAAECPEPKNYCCQDQQRVVIFSRKTTSFMLILANQSFI